MYGCLFHLSQNIHKHVSADSALNKLYLEQSAEGKATRTAIHSLAALAFIPPNEVPVRFVELRRAYALPGSPLRKLYDYFLLYYVGETWEDVQFPCHFWNVYGRFEKEVPRTTNHVEGWHFRMNNFLSGSHPDMWKCLELLQSEQHHWELETAKIASGIRKPFVSN
jgi:hypothetical protein